MYIILLPWVDHCGSTRGCEYYGYFSFAIYLYSCGLSTTTIEYSSLSVCLSVCLCTR